MKKSHQFVVCVKNKGYEASLEKRKIYEAFSDQETSTHRLLHVIDESGQDYLYPIDFFSPIKLPTTIIKKLALAA